MTSGQRRSHMERYYGNTVSEAITSPTSRTLDWEEATHYRFTLSGSGSLTVSLPYDVRNETTGLKLTVMNYSASTAFSVAGTSVAAGQTALVFLTDVSTAAGTYEVWTRARGVRTVLA